MSDQPRRCTATAKSTGQRCGRAPVPGATVCKIHGGGSPRVRAAARRRLDLAAAQQAVVTLGLPRDITPTDALLEEVRWTAGHVDWLRQRIQELEKADMTWGVVRVKDGGDDRGTTEQAGPPVWYQLYERERTHLVKVCAAAIGAGIEERRVRLAEQQGALVAEAIRRILSRLDLTAAQQLLVGEVVPAELRALAGGAAS
jgi:nucleotide-binding universal stress UspA family protein